MPRIGLRASLTLAAAATARRRRARALAVRRRAPARTRGPRGRRRRRSSSRCCCRRGPATCSRMGTGFYADDLRRPSQGLRDAERPVGAALLQGRHRDDALGRPPGLRPLLPLERQDRRVDGSGRHGEPAPARPPPDAAPPRSAGRVRARPRDRRLRGGRRRAIPSQSIEIADIEGAAREATQLLRRGEPQRPRRPARAGSSSPTAATRCSRATKTYDVIISDPSDVWVAGVGNLFTREFYALARSRLKPGGVMVQWFHMHSLPPEQMKLIVATFRSVFPLRVVLAAQPRRRDPDRQRRARAVGSRAASAARIETVPGVAEDLRGIGFWHPLSIFAAFVLDGEDLGAHARGRVGASTRTTTPSSSTCRRAPATWTRRPPTTPASRRCRRSGCRRSRASTRRATSTRAARYLLGFGMASIGRYDPAIPLMEESVRGDKPDPKFLVGLGNQYRAKGLTAKAARAYERALSLSAGGERGVAAARRAAARRGRRRGRGKGPARGLALAKDDAALAAAAARRRARRRHGRPKRSRC